MLDSIPALISTIQMIYAVSRYYNTSERMTSLFVKVNSSMMCELIMDMYLSQVTSQMVSACKQYITEKDHVRVWDVNVPVLLKRIDTCQQLYQRYQECFQQGKLKFKAGTKAFEISEMYVFGKFSSFSRRLDAIKEIINISQEYSNLKRCHLEGVEPLVQKFSHISSTLKKKPYSPLEHRKMEFVIDSEEFKRQIKELGDSLNIFMNNTFKKVSSCMQTLQLLKRCTSLFMYLVTLYGLIVVFTYHRFEKLNLKCLSEPILNKYCEVLGMFALEIDKIRKVLIFILIIHNHKRSYFSSTKSSFVILLWEITCLQLVEKFCGHVSCLNISNSPWT